MKFRFEQIQSRRISTCTDFPGVHLLKSSSCTSVSVKHPAKCDTEWMKSIVWHLIPRLAWPAAFRFYSKLAGRCAGILTPDRTTRSMKLPRGAVLRLDLYDGGARLIVASGTVWLTATPAKGDILLNAGGDYLLNGDGSYVVEALAAAEIILQTVD